MSQTNGIANTDAETTLLRDAGKIHEPPPGTEFSYWERKLWDYIMGSRLYRRWTNADMFLVVKIVRVDARIRKGYHRLDDMVRQGADIFDPESAANEYYNNIVKAEKHMLTMIRAIGLSRSPTPTPDPERNLHDAKTQQFNDAVEEINGMAPHIADQANQQRKSPGFLALQ